VEDNRDLDKNIDNMKNILDEIAKIGFTGPGLHCLLSVLKDHADIASDFFKKSNWIAMAIVMTCDIEDKAKAKDLAIQLMACMQETCNSRFQDTIDDIKKGGGIWEDDKLRKAMEAAVDIRDEAGPDGNPMEAAKGMVAAMFPDDPERQAQVLDKILSQMGSGDIRGSKPADEFNLLS